jgi:hypothetical protein
MLAFVVLVVMVRALFSHAVLLEPYGTPPLRSIELPTTRSALTDGIVRAYDQSSTDDEEGTVDLFGNEVTDAVAKYKFDATGSLYELHSPQTELPRLGSPKT